MDAVLFANPTAQSGAAEALIERARSQLKQAGLVCRFVPTTPEGGTVGLVVRAINEEHARRVVYMGGDGTFAEVAKGILLSEHTEEVVMGMLPTGTANDQGKSLGMEAGAEALSTNVAYVAAGATRRLDVGRIQRLDAADCATNTDFFFDSASFGFLAAVLRTRNRDSDRVEEIPVVRELYRDHLVYAGAMLKHLVDSYISQVKFDLDLVIDDHTLHYESLLDVVIKNTSVFGGEWILSPDSRPDDGMFELLPIAGRRDLTSKLLSTLRDAPFSEEDLRTLGIEHSRIVRGRQMLLTIIQPGVEDPPAVQIDGEEFPAGDRFLVEVLPRQLRVIVPPGSAQ